MDGRLGYHPPQRRHPHLARQHGISNSLTSSECSTFSHPPAPYPLSPDLAMWNSQASLNMGSFPGFRGQVSSAASISNVTSASSNNMSNFSQHYTSQPLQNTLRLENIDLGLPSGLAANTFEHVEPLPGPQDLEENSRRTAQRQSALNLPEWEEYRGEIKRLYIDELHSLEETREIMAKDFGFESSAQLYKTKLNEWGFAKYLPRSVAEWVLAKEKQRLEEGKTKTIYDYGGRRLDLAEVRRKAKRPRTQYLEPPVIEVETPKNLVYATPKTVAASPFSPRLSPPLVISQAIPHPAPRSWKPPPSSDVSGPDQIKLTWNGYTIAQLKSMHEDAHNLARLEEFEKAEAKFCEALNGHEYLLSSVHESTTTLAYDLANFYARLDRMRDAYAVLDWLIKEHLENSDVDDKETAAHISRVIQLLHSWSQSEEAINLLTSTLASCHALADNQHFGPSINPMTSETLNLSRSPATAEDHNFMLANPAAHFGDELSQLTCELKTAQSYSKAGKKEAENLLLRLINKCEQNTERFFAQHFEGACSLVEFYQKQKDLYKLFAALKSAGDIFWNIIEWHSGGPSTLKTAIKLVHLYIQAELAPIAKPMLERIEREVARVLDEDKECFDLLVTLGIYYQNHDGWTDAERCFEHALAIAMREHELDCKVVSTLEAVLETKCFSSQLPTPGGSIPKSRNAGFRRCYCSSFADETDVRY